MPARRIHAQTQQKCTFMLPHVHHHQQWNVDVQRISGDTNRLSAMKYYIKFIKLKLTTKPDFNNNKNKN